MYTKKTDDSVTPSDAAYSKNIPNAVTNEIRLSKVDIAMTSPT